MRTFAKSWARIGRPKDLCNNKYYGGVMGKLIPGLCPKFWWVAAALLLLSDAQIATAQETDACLKQVFGDYCLGGDVSRLEARQPMLRQNDGERFALVFQEGPERVYVLAFRGRIYKVLRRYRVTTQLRFDDIYSLLRDKYGEGNDRSRFPPYATTPSRRLGSIRRGDGSASRYWKVTQDWHIELTWTRELGIALAYVATALDRQQQEVAEGGL